MDASSTSLGLIPIVLSLVLVLVLLPLLLTLSRGNLSNLCLQRGEAGPHDMYL